MTTRQHAALGLLLTAVAVLALVAWTPDRGQYSLGYNGPDGLAAFMETFGVTPTDLTPLMDQPERKFLLVLPRRDLAAQESQGLSDFVTAGGTLLVASNDQRGGRLLEAWGIPLRLPSARLLDPVVNTGGESLGMASSSLQGSPQWQLVSASHVLNADPDDVLAWSSAFSFSDENGDGEWEEREPVGPFAVAAVAALGRGHVVVLADPGMLVQYALTRNQEFFSNLFQRQQVYFYEASLPVSAQEQAQTLLLQALRTLQQPTGTIFVLALAAALAVWVWVPNQGTAND